MEIPEYARVCIAGGVGGLSERDGKLKLMFNVYLSEGEDDEWIHKAVNLNDALTRTFQITHLDMEVDLKQETDEIFDKLKGFGISKITVYSRHAKFKDKYEVLGTYTTDELKGMSLFNHNLKFEIVEGS